MSALSQRVNPAPQGAGAHPSPTLRAPGRISGQGFCFRDGKSAMEPLMSTNELFAICHVNDVAKRGAVGFVLARRDDEGKTAPFPIFVLRQGKTYHAYVNRCPHQGARIDFQPGHFLDQGHRAIVCGKHGALFDVATGACTDGPCTGASLEKIEVVIDGEDVCITGVDLAEEDGLDRVENDEMPQIMITSD
jgi:nitrite reductase/ring-hydroxylating ferredoxin subunit